MKKTEDLLFLTKLYKTWPWYYDTDAIMEIKNKIIVSQHRELAKLKSQKDLKFKKPKKNKKYRKKTEFGPQEDI